MSEPKHEDKAAPPENDSDLDQSHSSTEPESSELTSAYISHARKVVTQPDDYFHEDTGASLRLGLINFAVFLSITFLYTFFVQVTRFSSWTFKFGHFTTGIRSVLAIGVPLAVAIYVLRWLAGKKDGATASTSYFVEKVGAILIVPSLLVAVALVLRIPNFDLYSWFRSAGLIAVYAGIFLLGYLHCSKNRIATATAVMIGFYFAYRLMLVLL